MTTDPARTEWTFWVLPQYGVPEIPVVPQNHQFLRIKLKMQTEQNWSL